MREVVVLWVMVAERGVKFSGVFQIILERIRDALVVVAHAVRGEVETPLCLLIHRVLHITYIVQMPQRGLEVGEEQVQMEMEVPLLK
jgi:hypothetical protein